MFSSLAVLSSLSNRCFSGELSRAMSGARSLSVQYNVNNNCCCCRLRCCGRLRLKAPSFCGGFLQIRWGTFVCCVVACVGSLTHLFLLAAKSLMSVWRVPEKAGFATHSYNPSGRRVHERGQGFADNLPDPNSPPKSRPRNRSAPDTQATLNTKRSASNWMSTQLWRSPHPG